MPTFKSYVNKKGYYINARPSSIGNITYQVDPDAAEFIVDLGYKHEDELPWGIVKPLRVAGLVYTKRQGVSEDDEGVPGLDPSKLPTLSKKELDELLAYLEARGDIPGNILERLRARLSDGRNDSTLVADAISEQLENQAEVKIKQSKGPDGRYGSVTIEVSYEVQIGLFNSKREVKHRINAVSSPGVDEWDVTHPYGDGWSGLAKATEEKISIMRALGDVSDKLSFEIRPYDGEATV